MPAPPERSRPERIRVGILGLGAVAQAVHLPLIERLRDAFEIHAIADVSPGLVAELGERYRVPPARRATSLEALLDVSGVEALVVMTSGSHGAAVQAGLARDMAVFAEKPLAFTLAEADAIAAQLEAGQSRRLQVGYMKLSDPAVVRALALAADEEVGAVRALEVTVLHPTSEAQLAFARLLPPPTDVPAAIRERFAAETDGLRRAALGDAAAATYGRLYSDVVLGSIVHELSLVRAFAADPVAIDSLVTWPADTWPPSVELTGRLPRDGRLSIRWHFLPDYPDYREEVRVVYEAATTELSFPAPYLLHRPTILRHTHARGGGRQDDVWTSTAEAFEEELLAFHAYVVDGRQPPAGLREGRADIVTSQSAIAAAARASGIEIGGEAAG